MENNRKNNLPEIKINVGSNSTAHVISATNNRAQYFADLAKKFRDEAKEYSELAKISAEQNSNVTFEYIDEIKNNLEDEISKKQIQGDYASRSELPKNVSELENDKSYVTQTTLSESLSGLELPSSEGNEGKFLSTDGENLLWNEVSTFSLFDIVAKDHLLSYEESKGFALQGTYVYQEALAGSRYGYPDFYAKCVEEKEAGTATQVTLGGETILMYVHSNGHKFYDIADKETVDKWYKTFGVADFYGVDTENKRVFLPRDLHGELVESYTDGTDGYRIWSDGYCEQWGMASSSASNSSFTITYPKTFANTDYCFISDHSYSANSDLYQSQINTTKSTTSATLWVSASHGTLPRKFSWEASGYLASDQYTAPTHLIYYVVGTTTSYNGMSEVVSQGMTILEQVNQGLSSKADVDLENSSIVHIIDTYVNDTSGYIIWSNGYCEQWGWAPDSGVSYSYLKSFANSDYNLLFTTYSGSNSSFARITVKTATNFTWVQSGYAVGCYWKASGYLAKGEY